MKDTLKRLKLIIAEHLQPALSVTLDITFAELGADSLDLVEILMACEEEFGINVSDREAEKMKKVRDVVDFIESKNEATQG